MTGSGASPLVGVSALADALAVADPPVLIDVRWRLGGPPGIDRYRAGHVPGAVYADLDTQLAGPPGEGGRHPLPGQDAFESAMRAAGVRDDHPVVVYDDADSTIAARAWWLLSYHGHRLVRVLDGGLRAWAAAGLPVSVEEVEPVRGNFTARPGQLPVLDAAGAADVAGSGTLLDARAPARYRGETEPVDKVAGHIPGALSAPTAENVTADGLFRTADELRSRFSNLGIRAGLNGHESAAEGERPVGVYCGSGVTATHQVLALELAGIRAALYAGSWSDWIADPARPIATGPRPGNPPA